MTTNTINNIKDILLWKKCVFMTFEQYKNKKVHLNEKIYYHEGLTNNIKKHIIEHIKGLANQLPFKKVPKPIYVLISKHIEYDEKESILPYNCKQAYNDVINKKINYDSLNDVFDKNKDIATYKNYDISCFKKTKDELYNINDIPKYKFIYDNLEGDENKNLIMKSSLSSYKFKGLYEVIIYVPNLNKDLQYFTSFQDFSYQNRWMDLIVNSSFLNIIPLTKDYTDDVINMLGEKKYNANKEKMDTVIKKLNDKNSDEYPLVKDLTNICFDMGCSSKYGEDLNEIIPSVSKTYDEQLSNAKSKGPYFPTKCLKTNYYDKHMMKLQGNKEKNEYKEGLGKKIIENIDNFMKNSKKVNNGETPDEGYSGTNIIDVIKGASVTFRNEQYKEGNNDTDYSREYNRKILSELAFRHNSYPGVQEIIFPAFRLNDNFSELIDYTHFMPWGNILLKNEYVLNEGDLLDIEKTSLKSFNNIYELKFDNMSKLSIFENGKLKRILINVQFNNYIKKSIIFQNGSLNIYGYDKNGFNDNRYGLFVSNSNAISPLSIVIENNGDIVLYDNGFNVIRKL